MANNKGFTLTEPLIVVAIIGILATFAVISFLSMRQQARDARRTANIRAITQGLELYLAQDLGYPPSSGTCVAGGNTLATILVDSIRPLPSDPLWPTTEPVSFNSGSGNDYPKDPSAEFCYWYFSDDIKSYYLSYFLETSSETSGVTGIHVLNQDGVIK